MTDPNGQSRGPRGANDDAEATVAQPARQNAAGQGEGSRADRIVRREGDQRPQGGQQSYRDPQGGWKQQRRNEPAGRSETTTDGAGHGDRNDGSGKKAAATGFAAGAGMLASKFRGRKSEQNVTHNDDSVASAVPRPAKSSTDAAGPTPVKRLGEARRTRKARLRLSQVDPWSVMKTAFLFSVAAGIVLWVATGTVWGVIGSSGLFNSLNQLIGEVVQTPGDTTPFRIQDYVNTNKVMGTAALIAVVDVVIFTALATLGAFLYNLASAMIGGLEVTLAED